MYQVGSWAEVPIPVLYQVLNPGLLELDAESEVTLVSLVLSAVDLIQT